MKTKTRIILSAFAISLVIVSICSFQFAKYRSNQNTIATFQACNVVLSKSIENSERENNVWLSAIKDESQKSKKPQDLELSKQLFQLHDRIIQLNGYLNETIKDLERRSGGYKYGTQVLRNPVSTSQVEDILFGNSSKGNAIQHKIITHVTYLNDVALKVSKITGVKYKRFNYLALNGKDDPFYVDQNTKEEIVTGAKSLSFSELNFKGTSLAETINILYQKELALLIYERAILDMTNGYWTIKGFKFDQVTPVVVAESNTVVAGREYNASLFLVNMASEFTPKMTTSAGSLKMEDNVGIVRFRAGGGGYENGVAKKSWKGSITIPKNDGGDTTMILTTPYNVVTPVLKVSTSSSALYKNCANHLHIACPLLGADFKPSYSVHGGSKRKGKKTGDVIIYPYASKVKMTVASNGQAIGTEVFKVKEIPLPSIELNVNSTPINPSGMVSGLSSFPTSLTVKAIPETGFQTTFPKEANYVVSKWTARLFKGKEQIGSIKSFTTSTGNLSSFESKNGDKIVLEIQEVIRKNSLGKTEKVNIGTVVRTINL